MIRSFFAVVPFFIQTTECRWTSRVQQQLMVSVSPSVTETSGVWTTEGIPDETEGELKLYLLTQTSPEDFDTHSKMREDREKPATTRPAAVSSLQAQTPTDI